MTTDAQILSALRAESGCGVSGTELSQQLRVSRAAIWARIEELRKLGYDIEASPQFLDLWMGQAIKRRVGTIKALHGSVPPR